jgi:hypothetical protein
MTCGQPTPDPSVSADYAEPSRGVPVRREHPTIEGVPADVRDLLTDEQKAKLDADLQRMAKQRRAAEAAAANVWLS